jgi:hypothetical protein
MRSAKFERDPLRFRRGVENLKEEVAVLEAQVAELEQKNLRSPVLLQKHCDCNHFAALTYSALLLGVQV